MKIIYVVGLLCLACLFSFHGLAQNEKFEKAMVENNIRFTANGDSVWHYLSNLGNLQYLVPSTIRQSVLEGSGVGSKVTLNLQNGDKIIEQVTALDNEKRVISYSMIQTPLPIRDYLASFEVKEIKKEVEVTFRAEFSVQESNKQRRIAAFNNLQLELLENIKRIKSTK